MLSTLYWVCMLLLVILGAWRGTAYPAERPWAMWGVIPFVLFVIIGLKLFPIQS